MAMNFSRQSLPGGNHGCVHRGMCIGMTVDDWVVFFFFGGGLVILGKVVVFLVVVIRQAKRLNVPVVKGIILARDITFAGPCNRVCTFGIHSCRSLSVASCFAFCCDASPNKFPGNKKIEMTNRDIILLFFSSGTAITFAKLNTH